MILFKEKGEHGFVDPFCSLCLMKKTHRERKIYSSIRKGTCFVLRSKTTLVSSHTIGKGTCGKIGGATLGNCFLLSIPRIPSRETDDLSWISKSRQHAWNHVLLACISLRSSRLFIIRGPIL